MLTATVLCSLLAAWVVFNLVAPRVAVLRAEPIGWGRLPAELLTMSRDRRVRFYHADLSRGYGYSVWAPLSLNVVIFDRTFYAHASPALVRFVVAHELAHFHAGHHRWRWAAVVSGAILLPAVRRWLLAMEAEADAEAERRTGYDRSMFKGFRDEDERGTENH